MLIVKNDFLNKLKVLSEASESKVFGDSGYLKCYNGNLYTNNPSLSVFISVPTEINFNFAVNMKEILKVLNGMKTENIDIELKNDILVLKSGKTTVKMNCFDFNSLLKENIEVEAIDIVDDFSKLHGYLYLPDIHCKYQAIVFRDNIIYTSNGFIINALKLKTNFEDLSLSLNNLNFLKRKFIKYYKYDNFISFEDELSFRFDFLLCDDFNMPVDKIKTLIEKSNGDGLSVELNDDFFQSLNLAQNFSKKTNTIPISLKIMENSIEVTAQNQIGDYSDSIPVNVTNFTDEEILKVDFNALISFKEKANKFSINKSNFPILVFNGENSTHLLATLS